jgi:hypothetical protein
MIAKDQSWVKNALTANDVRAMRIIAADSDARPASIVNLDANLNRHNKHVLLVEGGAA